MAEIIKPKKLTLSIPEAAKIVGVSESKMYQIAKIKGFPTIKLGTRRIRVSAPGLERWLEEQAEKGWYV